MKTRKHLITYLLACAALVVAGTSVSAQQYVRSSTNVAPIENDSIWIAAQVMDLDTQGPVAYANVEIDGRSVPVRANEEGKIFFRAPRHGKRAVSVRAIGYEPHTANFSAADVQEGDTNIWLIRVSGDSPRHKVTRESRRERQQDRETRTASAH